MKYFSILAIVLPITLILSACGVRAAQVTPTPVDIQGSAAAVALTMIAQTQTAIPTATPIPPTSTNIPALVDTLPPLPANPITATPGPTSNAAGGDPCIYKVLPRTLQGNTVKMRIDNSTKVTVSITVYLNQTVAGGLCGYRSYTLDSGQYVVINDLVEGCYSLWAWNPDPKGYFMVTNGTSCLDTSANWLFDVSTGNIQLRR